MHFTIKIYVKVGTAPVNMEQPNLLYKYLGIGLHKVISKLSGKGHLLKIIINIKIIILL